MSNTVTTIAAAFAAARTSIPPAEARLLLGHVLGCSSAWLEAHREAALTPQQLAAFAGLVERRAAGEPVAYLLGTREFYGRDFAVTSAVLIPRPETELLVDVALAKVGAGKTAISTTCILDLGTGSGCIAITLALELPGARVTAVDVAPPALEVARVNAQLLGASVDLLASDWFAALPEKRFDFIVANPPYVAAGDPHLRSGDLRFEPLDALTDQADGLAALRHIVATAPRWLKPGGSLFFEHGFDQAAAVFDLLVAAGFSGIEQHRDLAGIVRVSVGSLLDPILPSD
ncbi:MAG: peptide chain release factor N(5)-glutamine methyltransferase [Gammaproteobacteria bacterium]|nr:peptide chain release factor N(5)-glutamine methyltransferase [Rhodocyclaceae bacterium]MBU3910597.1 peptide chain release factor N(5)-glutamine methyltransferase [Gammaproteobacteria bacterium]MBU3990710.1 peptide chain release factor N(5)-glutamine methyltransferase [Gammaproteobacteria bacterium]MBU4005078.1 peptide chain release factor N(5)-glutamine methyltransferase [Gammaproteobacteria bacterium]MBU4020671.1 peptide chain release factor N(5)-glutamine methyltransferase [Gammaproteobac